MRYLWALLPLSLCGQNLIHQDFSAGQSLDSLWLGNLQNFEFRDSALALNDSVAGQSTLYHSSDVMTAARWDFHGRMDFNPSSSNYLKIQVMLSQLPPDSSLFGYYLKLGGNAQDQIQFYRQDPNGDQLLAVSAADFLDLNTVQYHISLRRSADLLWELYADTGSFEQWYLQASFKDSNHRFSAGLALTCHYTKTRSTKFYFDSLHIVGAAYPDSIAPKFVSWSLKGDSALQLNFSEKLAPPQLSAFEIQQGNQLASLNWQAQNPRELSLNFKDHLPPNQPILLRMENLSDLFGNQYSDSLTLLYRQVLVGELRINEIMADPSPKVDLNPNSFPEVEFIELINVSQLAIPMDQLEVQIGERFYSCPPFWLQPDSLLVLSAANTAVYWPAQIPVLGLNWSSSALTNDGNRIAIYNSDVEEIESLHYSSDWYQDALKAEGGWSLERKDPSSDCHNIWNWQASKDPSGATPGRRNSIADVYHDSLQAEVLALKIPSPFEIQIDFNRSLYGLSPWQIDPPVLIDSLALSKDAKSHFIYLAQALEEGLLYRVFTEEGLVDCRNHIYQLDSLKVGLALKPLPGQVRISEVLFNPYPQGKDFVEIRNLGPGFLDLADLRLAVWNSELQEAIDAKVLSQEHRLIAADSCLVLATEAAALQAFYRLRETNFQVVAELPSMPDDGVQLLLMRSDFEILDRINLDEDSHAPFLNSGEGVSLYRLDFQQDALRQDQWQSSPATWDYATPGWCPDLIQNRTSKVQWQAHPDYLSPNGDGYRDYLELHYKLAQDAWIQVHIYDRLGNLQKEIIAGDQASAEGFVVWQGQDERGQLCATGVYLAFLEYRFANGEMGRARCCFVLSH